MQAVWQLVFFFSACRISRYEVSTFQRLSMVCVLTFLYSDSPVIFLDIMCLGLTKSFRVEAVHSIDVHILTCQCADCAG